MNRFFMHTSVAALGLVLAAGTQAFGGGHPSSGSGHSSSYSGSRGPSYQGGQGQSYFYHGSMNQGRTFNQFNTSKGSLGYTKSYPSYSKYTASKHFDFGKHGYKSLYWNRYCWSSYYHCYCYWAPYYRSWCFYEPTYSCYVPVSYYSSVYPDSYQPTLTTPTVTSTPPVVQQTTVLVSSASPVGDAPPAPPGPPGPPAAAAQQTTVAPGAR
jgi:hypothetical protein